MDAPPQQEVVDEVKNNKKCGEYTGCCKWFSRSYGFGFITVTSEGEHQNKDIFVHHTGIKPLNSSFRTLTTGEYINFDVVSSDKGLQAVSVTGIGGGALMCDRIVYQPRRTRPPPTYMRTGRGGRYNGPPRTHAAPVQPVVAQ